jgi:preprotein translocase subunit SecG
MSDQKQDTPNVYKTSKTTWFLIAFMAVILIIIIFMMMRKKKDGTEGDAGAESVSFSSSPGSPAGLS